MNTNIKIQDKPVKSMTIKEAAEEMGKSQQFVRIGIQRGRLTFGTAEILTGNKYTYYISPPLFFQYIGKPLPSKYKEKEETEKLDESIIKREKMVIYILVNYPTESYEKIKDTITVDSIKDSVNKQIISKIYEEYSLGKQPNILDLFTEEEIINYLSGIMAEDFGIVDIDKCIEDLLAIYNKEKLVNTRNEIIKKLENTNNMTKEEIHKLEESLNEVILKLAKVK